MRNVRHWLWLVLGIPVALGIARLRLDVEILNLLPPSVPAVQGLKLHQRAFSDARELILTVEAADAETASGAARQLALLLRSETNLVSDALWQPAWMESPALATELVAALWLNQPPGSLASLARRLDPEHVAPLLAGVQQELATSLSPEVLGRRGYDPLGLLDLPESVQGTAPQPGQGDEMFAADGGTYRLVFVEAAPDLAGYRACQDWMRSVQGLLEKARQTGTIPPQVRVGFTGRPAFVAEISGSMENDMAGSAGGTLAVIGILFWLSHRRVRPLLWLLLILLVVLAATTAVGGLLLGTINVVSMGFASILLGLSEDFGIVLYQESRSHPELDAPALRRLVAPGILWSAVTTAGAFLVLNLSSLPGLGQLGTLVAVGILLSAGVMLYGYLPPLLRLRRPRDLAPPSDARREAFLLFNGRPWVPASALWVVSAGLLAAAAGLQLRSGFQFDASPNVLRPSNSTAYSTLEEIKRRFSRDREPMWLLVSGADETAVRERLLAAQGTLRAAVDRGEIESYLLPTALWPNPAAQQANRAAAAEIVAARGRLRDALLQAGFTADATAVLDAVCNTWSRAAATPGVFWPDNRVSGWILRKVASHRDGQWLALGSVRTSARTDADGTALDVLSARLSADGALLSGWDRLGSSIFRTVLHEMPLILLPILALVLVSLWLAFRDVKEVLLSLFTLAFTGLCLNAAMILLGWRWNLLNLMAIPLLLGMGVDFSIHMQLALRREGGDFTAVRGSIGRALLLAGATTVAGFVSLAFSNSGGMASLGRVCGLGITLALLIAVHLMPVWWRWVHSPRRAAPRGM